MLQTTMKSASEHIHSTASAMHPESLAPWLAGMPANEVKKNMCYIVPRETIMCDGVKGKEGRIE